jgi:hypothetical protein
MKRKGESYTYSRPSGEKSKNWAAKSYINSKNKLILCTSGFFILSLRFERGNLQLIV